VLGLLLGLLPGLLLGLLPRLLLGLLPDPVPLPPFPAVPPPVVEEPEAVVPFDTESALLLNAAKPTAAGLYRNAE